jgi:G2/mitotic-specific cyclin 1/2
MDLQPELDWSMRATTVDWMASLHQALHLHHESLHLAIHVLDRFLSLRVAERSRLQLYALCALLIAAKMDDAMKPGLEHFLVACNHAYTKQELQQAERYVLHVLQFDLAYGNPLCFLRRISKADLYDEATRTVAKYFVDVCRTSPHTTSFASSKIASASMWLARRVLKRGNWDANLVHYSGYCEQELTSTVRGVYDLLQNTRSFPSLYAKHSSVAVDVHGVEKSVTALVDEWMQSSPSWAVTE